MEELVRVSFVVSEEHRGERLDIVVTKYLKDLSAQLEDDDTFRVSRSQVGNWIGSGFVLINELPSAKTGTHLVIGDRVEIAIPRVISGELQPDSSVPLEVVHEEESFVVLNKGPGQVVHPGAGVLQGTIANALFARYGEAILHVGSSLRPGIVHRLDKDTTGLLVVAKTKRAYESFVSQFAKHLISRRYIGLTMKLPKGQSPIDLPLGRDPHDRTKMSVSKSGKRAVTHWRVREQFSEGGYLLELVLETGRTHQIRAHLHARHASLVGDDKYPCSAQQIPSHLRSAVKQFGRQALHAEHLQLQDPESGAIREFAAPIPSDFERLLEQFRGAK